MPLEKTRRRFLSFSAIAPVLAACHQ
ncbi:hypothetical protein CQA49_02085 [Helicobacter sp. MIT 00-7814]|nr:hypothetical protein CQA37_02530 [Helicobacter sp. MIT 99-10781]RDU56335.1 hypothetical protein CQA49_02085 [Helicobacter sp. MIT 00-7814]